MADFETKRMALEMLSIKVWIDDHNVEIIGILPLEADVIATTQIRQDYFIKRTLKIVDSKW